MLFDKIEAEGTKGKSEIWELLFGFITITLWDAIDGRAFASLEFVWKFFGVSIYTDKDYMGKHISLGLRISKLELTLKGSKWN